MGNGDLAGSWPIHVRNARTGRILTLDERPKFWLNGYRDGDRERPMWQPDRTPPPPQRTPDGKQHPYHLTPDVAHMGSYAHVPYLVTGDFGYLEEAYFWGVRTVEDARIQNSANPRWLIAAPWEQRSFLVCATTFYVRSCDTIWCVVELFCVTFDVFWEG